MNNDKKLVENLKALFNSKSKEELKAIWESGSYLDSVGLKVTDYLEQRGDHVKIVEKETTPPRAYVVLYGTGVYEEYYERTVFITLDKNKAEKYVAKFNSLLKKLKEFYIEGYLNHRNEEQPDPDSFYATDTADDRYYLLYDVVSAFIREEELR